MITRGQLLLKAIRGTIREGRQAAKKDPNGPMPPLSMPTWGDVLSGDEIDALIIYLIGQQNWDEKDDDDKKKEKDDDVKGEKEK